MAPRGPRRAKHAPTGPNAAPVAHNRPAQQPRPAAPPSNRKPPARRAPFTIDENLRIAVQMQIDAFLDNPAETRLDLPASLTSEQRGYVHQFVRAKGLKSQSTGRGADRFLSLFKRVLNTVVSNEAHIRLSTASRQLCAALSTGPHRATGADLQRLARYDRPADKSPTAAAAADPGTTFRCSLGAQFQFAVPPVPREPGHRQHLAGRQALPVYAHRDHLLEMLRQQQVLVISGDTGSGKTTQIPQYVLEEAQRTQQPCRIICTQPRRLAAISIADRVAAERGEQIGHTVGYQIRLESRISQTSNLIYTTSGFLLRCLISGTQRELFSSVTHLILDEVHERDKFTDFLLIVLRDALADHPHLRIVLMSATIDSDVFGRYFGGCPHAYIPGRMFPVHVYNLEETLELIGYHNGNVERFRREQLEQHRASDAATAMVVKQAAPGAAQPASAVLDKGTQDYVDEVLEECFCSPLAEPFDQFVYLVGGESVPIDTQHSQTRMTALMSAASKGFADIVRRLCALGADPTLCGVLGLNAIAWAQMNQHAECAAFLVEHARQRAAGVGQPTTTAAVDARTAAEDERRRAHRALLLRAYQFGRDESIDHALLCSIVAYVHRTAAGSPGAILVFLPGYDAIVDLNDALHGHADGRLADELAVFMLHGNMQPAEQKRVFEPAPAGRRKCILSTNIAETSLTIDDVVYVIDSGLVKQKSFDAQTGATALMAQCISQACAKQRTGRAGRVQPGVCFRAYSQLRYDSMDRYTLPEILRVPLTEIALSARIMCGTRHGSIGAFLAHAIQPPSESSVAKSIALLRLLGALDADEQCTPLGRLLVDLPVDVQLGKALLYGIVLRCLDPVLTIVSALSVKDPFVLGLGRDGEATARALRRSLADGSRSDHMTLLRIYQQWNESKSSGNERQFCRENYVSSGAMQMICNVRQQILGHLRSIGLIQHRAPGNIHELNRHSDNWSMVKACLLAGLYPNVARIDRDSGKLKTRDVDKLVMHPSSVLRQKNPRQAAEDLRALPSEWIAFEQLNWAGNNCMIRWNTVVSPISVALLAGRAFMPETGVQPLSNEPDSDSCSENDEDDDDDDDDGLDNGGALLEPLRPKARFIVDGWINFTMDEEEARLVRDLRQRLNVIVMKLIGQPQRYVLSKSDQHCIDVLANVLAQEDRFCGLEQPLNVGRRPVAVKLNMSSDEYRQSMDTFSNRSAKDKQFLLQRPGKHGSHEASGRNDKFIPSNRPEKSTSSSSSVPQRPHMPGKGMAPVAAVRDKRLIEQRVNVETARFFILHAASEMQVQQHFSEPTEWCWSMELLRMLILVTQRFPGVDVVLFYYIPAQGLFYGLAKFQCVARTFRTDQLSLSSVSADRLRLIWYKPVNGRPTNTFDSCENGEEISDRRAAKLLLEHFS